MRRQRLWRILVGTAALLAACALTAGPALAAQPVVKVVPWVASNPLIPHDTWSGKSVRLKGTVNLQGATIQYIWDFGDGSPVATGIVSNMYAVEASHAYTGSVGTVFTARLTVQDTSTGESDNKAYFVGIQAKALPVEVNVAIDEGLWYLHKTQTRSGDVGYWTSGYAGSGYYGITALDINAFEVNGHLESGSADNPYVETVARGLRRLFTYLTSSAIGPPDQRPRHVQSRFERQRHGRLRQPGQSLLPGRDARRCHCRQRHAERRHLDRPGRSRRPHLSRHRPGHG